jgi:hypothetical protein
MTDEARSAQTRARAEAALVRLLYELRDDEAALIVLGGLVPYVLTKDTGSQIPAHLGTTDVDVLLITQVNPDVDLGSVERALERLKFEPDPRRDGWRWRGVIDDAPVLIEFLCDLDDYREGEIIRPTGCERLAAANLRGTGYVARDYERQELRGRLGDGTEVTVQARFAGLQGYLLSKCVTARSRAADKDYYDFVYVLSYNRAGGPEQAARALRSGQFADDLGSLRSTFLELRERFKAPGDAGPSGYAAQASQVDLEASDAQLRADAVDVVQRFIDELEV